MRSRVLQMGGMVEEQITPRDGGLISGDMELIDKVIADDHRVNAMEVALDEDLQHDHRAAPARRGRPAPASWR